MLQRGVNISSLDTSYITSMSWYVLVVSNLTLALTLTRPSPLMMLVRSNPLARPSSTPTPNLPLPLTR